MSNAGQYRADNRVTINNVTELNLIVDALQTAQGRALRAAAELDRRGTPISRMMHIRAVAQGKLLDRLRVGWKGADKIPEEIQAQLAAREDARFWSDIPTRIKELAMAPVRDAIAEWNDHNVSVDFGIALGWGYDED